MLGAAIALSNVVLPSVVRAEFATRIPLMMGLYSMALSAGAAAGAGLTVPFERGFGIGWRPALGLWALPAAIALGVWLGELRRHERRNPARRAGTLRDDAEASALRRLWRDRLAWAVTGFMGLQSLGFYAALAFVPTLYQSHLSSHGLSAARAGWLLSFSNFPAIAAGSAHSPSAGRQPIPNPRSKGTVKPAPAAAPADSAIEYSPIMSGIRVANSARTTLSPPRLSHRCWHAAWDAATSRSPWRSPAAPRRSWPWPSIRCRSPMCG